jgi:2-polyprenyl-6-methoxyphenol hydroxylase-like FAD-dependent oxidoreductase
LEAARVLIAGAGPVGLATAIELQSRGIRVMLVERDATTTRHPQKDVTNGRSMEHLRRIGIAESIRDAGVALLPALPHFLIKPTAKLGAAPDLTTGYVPAQS